MARSSIFKLTSPLIFFFILILLVPSSHAQKVEPVWPDLEYSQGEVAQFILFGDSNQTNISCKVISYYDPDPLDLDKNLSKEATKFFIVPKLNKTGVGLFEVELIGSNGFERVGNYNLTFIFGEDVLNETGFEIYTAPRDYIHFRLRLNEQVLIGEINKSIQENKDTYELAIIDMNEFKQWTMIFAVVLIFVISCIIFKFWWDDHRDEGILSTIWICIELLYSKSKTPRGDFSDQVKKDNMKELKRSLLNFVQPKKDFADKKVRKLKHDLELWTMRQGRFNKEFNVIEEGIPEDDPYMALIVRRGEDGKPVVHKGHIVVDNKEPVKSKARKGARTNG